MRTISFMSLTGVALIMPVACMGEAKLLGAAFLNDRHPSFPWTEGAKGIERWYEESYRTAGLVRIWFVNTGREPLSAKSLKVGERAYAAWEMIKGEEVVWWRLRPDPVPPGAAGQAEVRLREPPSGPIAVEIMFTEGPPLAVEVPNIGPRLRIGRICFTTAGVGVGERGSVIGRSGAAEDPSKESNAPMEAPSQQDSGVTLRRPKSANTVVVWCTVPTGFKEAVGLSVDGCPVPAADFSVLGPWRNALAVVHTPRKLLDYGSFHHFAVTAGGKMADGALVRARDDFFPLGTYGYVKPREYAGNSLNLYTSFGTMSAKDLDSLQAHGIRGITRVTGWVKGQGPAQETLGHPAIWAYYLHDEPDCADYGVEGIPQRVRIGTYAMEMAARERNCYHAEPQKLSYLVINQTYKPANWFIYGPIADVCATDHYPPPGKEKEVFSTVETCRLGCAPQMLVFIFRAWWPEPLEPKEGESKGRMMFGGEERLHIGWGLAGGAQGLISYIHCTEPAGKSMFHGAGEFPDVWHAIGQMYREVKTVAPLLAESWPVDGAVKAPEGVYARALVAPEGVVIVAINEQGCTSTDDDFIVRPVEQVNLEVSMPPWITNGEAALVGEGRFEALEGQRDGEKLAITLPRLDTARLIAVAPRSVMNALEQRYAEEKAAQAEGVLRGLQYELEREAVRLDLVRRIPARYKSYVAYAESQEAYGVEKPRTWWNPQGEKYNVVEWYSPDKPGEHWVRWRFDTQQAGAHYFVFMWYPMKFALRMTVEDSSGKRVAEQVLTGDGEDVYAVRVSLPAPGAYSITLAARDEKGSGARVSKAAFLVPQSEASLLPEAVLGSWE